MLSRAGDDLTLGNGGEGHGVGGAGDDHPPPQQDTQAGTGSSNAGSGGGCGGYVPPGKTADKAGGEDLGICAARRVLWPPVAEYTTRPAENDPPKDLHGYPGALRSRNHQMDTRSP